MTKIHIESVEFAVDDDLTADERSKIADEVQSLELNVGINDPDSLWVNEFQELKHVLQDQGYFKARMELTTHLIKAEEGERQFALTVRDFRGPQYRLGQIRFENATVFEEPELRKAIHLQTGEIFDLSAIREGLESVGERYRAQGYIDETPAPIKSIDEESKKIDLVIRVDEGKQYHIGRVDLSGLDPSVQASSASFLVTGQVFDQESYSHFLEENKTQLIYAADRNKTIGIRRNPAHATIDFTVESAKCSSN
jgi:outer membrane translocation and assembly module TamA